MVLDSLRTHPHKESNGILLSTERLISSRRRVLYSSGNSDGGISHTKYRERCTRSIQRGGRRCQTKKSQRRW
nr:MAG TPA: hypothetical protein [Caudoviricetes sp.]